MEPNTKIVRFVVNDIILAIISIVVGFNIAYDKFPTFGDIAGINKLVIYLVILVFISHLTGIYKFSQDTSCTYLIAQIFLCLSISFFWLTTIYYSVPNLMFVRGELALFLVFFGIFQFTFYALLRIYIRSKGFSKRILILGTGPLARQMGEIIKEHEGSYALAGYVMCDKMQVNVPVGLILDTGDDLYETVRRENVDKIVVSLSERRNVFPLQGLMTCKLRGIEVVDAPSFYERLTGKLLLESITPSWFIFSGGSQINSLILLTKRFIDVLFSVTGIILFLPLLPIIALAIRFDSPGPIFFTQVRVGQGERNFVLYKFRTIRADAEYVTGAVWSIKNDPRLTRLGSFLRISRIDEIPALINVLKGDMSLVGPRPERPEFVLKLKEIIPYYSERHYVKPGITGWAQVRYPYGASIEDVIDKLRYDLYYIKNISITFDFMIMLETIKITLLGRIC